MKFLGIHLTNDMDDKLDIFNKRGDFMAGLKVCLQVLEGYHVIVLMIYFVPTVARFMALRVGY